MGKLDTFTEHELQLNVTVHWDFPLPNLVFKFKAAVGWNNGVGPEGSGTSQREEEICEGLLAGIFRFGQRIQSFILAYWFFAMSISFKEYGNRKGDSHVFRLTCYDAGTREWVIQGNSDENSEP